MTTNSKVLAWICLAALAAACGGEAAGDLEATGRAAALGEGPDGPGAPDWVPGPPDGMPPGADGAAGGPPDGLPPGPPDGAGGPPEGVPPGPPDGVPADGEDEGEEQADDDDEESTPEGLECPVGPVGEIRVEFACDSLTITTCRELSNIVIEFEDGTQERIEDLEGQTGTFSGTGANAGKTIVRVWVKAGGNLSGEGPGFGTPFERGEGDTCGTPDEPPPPCGDDPSCGPQ